MNNTVEFLRNYIRRLVDEDLRTSRALDYSHLDNLIDLYKRQIERLGGTNVRVSASLNYSHDTIDLLARFNPPPEPIEITFTIQPSEGKQ